jgi:hypothetical protein
MVWRRDYLEGTWLRMLMSETETLFLRFFYFPIFCCEAITFKELMSSFLRRFWSLARTLKLWFYPTRLFCFANTFCYLSVFVLPCFLSMLDITLFVFLSFFMRAIFYFDISFLEKLWVLPRSKILMGCWEMEYVWSLIGVLDDLSEPYFL